MAKQLVDGIDDPGHLADLIAANMDATVEEKHGGPEAWCR
jgi:hypothetical protein